MVLIKFHNFSGEFGALLVDVGVDLCRMRQIHGHRAIVMYREKGLQI